MNSLELFVGAGGLALGVARAGFQHVLVVDSDENACNTLKQNHGAGVDFVRDWRIEHQDVRKVRFGEYQDKIHLVSGGPPCQPFSLGGKHLGHRDERNMFPQAVRVVRETRPKAFVFENVKGLLRRGFENYYGYIIHQLRYPELVLRTGEDWLSHLARLEKQHTSGRCKGLHYNVVHRLLNAADFGVPQRRERVFIVGVRADLGIEFNFPEGRYTEESLIHEKWVTGEYWERHRVPRAKRPGIGVRDKARLERIASVYGQRHPAPAWRTVRDAIADLPVLRPGQTDDTVPNHFLNPGARAYAGHTGSNMDEPAKTLKAGDHGVPGGENTVSADDGLIRYFSVRECARLQEFPDDWVFVGSWTECMRQLGNAVPVGLAQSVTAKVSRVLGMGLQVADALKRGARDYRLNRSCTQS